VGSEAVSGDFHFCAKAFRSLQVPSKPPSISFTFLQKISISFLEYRIINDLLAHSEK